MLRGANHPAVLSLEHRALLSPTVLVDPAGLAEYFKKSSDEEREHAEKLMEQQVLIKSLQYQFHRRTRYQRHACNRYMPACKAAFVPGIITYQEINARSL